MVVNLDLLILQLKISTDIEIASINGRKIYFTVAKNLLKISPRKSIILYEFALNEIFSAPELSLLKNEWTELVFVVCFFFVVVQPVSTGIFWVTTQILPMGNKNKGL